MLRNMSVRRGILGLIDALIGLRVCIDTAPFIYYVF